MAYTKEKLDYLLATKDIIRSAIESRGVAVADEDTFRSYAAKIQMIENTGDAPSGLESYTPFPKQTLTFTKQSDSLWTHIIDGKAMNLIEGETYFVYWGSGTYSLTATAGTFNGSPGIGLGNEFLANSEAEDTGGYLLIYVLDDGSETGFYELDTYTEGSTKQTNVNVEYVRIDDNLRFASAAFARDASYTSGDSKVFIFDNFITPTGMTIGTVAPYAFAGFGGVEKMKITGTAMHGGFAFAGDEALKIIDITANPIVPSIAFLPDALNGCTALEALIARASSEGLNIVNFFNGATTGSNSTFCVYVPSAYYDAVLPLITQNGEISADRVRKLEDYPEIDNWYEEWLASQNK